MSHKLTKPIVRPDRADDAMWPLWLQHYATDDESPFHPRTREHLRHRAKTDPRVIELIERLQEKDTAVEGEGRREREWARQICNGNYQVICDLHKKFSPTDQDDILRLAAYISDHSLAHFFSEYASRISSNSLHGEERGRCNDALKLITPIVAELQPAVAIGFASQILEVYQHMGEPETALGLFTDIARKLPYQVLAQEERFADMPGVIEAAHAETKKPHAADSFSEISFAGNVQARREIAHKMQALGISRN